MASESRGRLPQRSELTEEQRWNIESVFPTLPEWEAEYRRISDNLAGLDGFRGRLADSPATLLGTLQLRDELSGSTDRLATYAFLRQTEDAANSTFTALADRAGAIWARTAAAGAFVEPEILEMDGAILERFVAEEPALAEYQHFFDRLNRMREHTRSADVEEVLAEAEEMAGSFFGIHSALENADLKLGTIVDESGDEVELGQGNLQLYLHSPNRGVRQAAWLTSADAYRSMQHTFAGTLRGTVKKDVFYARARNFESSLEAVLAPQAVPAEVFHNLIDTVWKNLSTWHRYFAIRKRILGVDALHEWDITAPLVETSRHIPLAEGVEMIAASLAPLGEEYVSVLKQGVADRWVDPYANAGKHGGAFSSGTKGTLPFISMSYQDDFNSVSTLTHELGHSMHSYHTWETQPDVYADYGMMIAETASNMHQALMGRDLLSRDLERSFLIEVIEERMSNHLRYFFTMPILARFEHENHQRVEAGEALTADEMTERLADIYEEAYGGEAVVDRERMGITWARFPHLFQAYYVYNYAIGIAAAAQLSQQVLTEGEPALKRYIGFLKAGGSKYQIEALRDAGVDMRDPAPVQAAFDILAGYVDRLDELTR